MKFTEGYWERNERANAIYASQAYSIEKIPGGMRMVAPVRKITDRAGALDVSTITTEFTANRENVISVRSYHFEGYEKREPRFELFEEPQNVHVEISDEEAVMTVGKMKVRINREDFAFSFEGDGRHLTGCGFRNLGYMQYDRTVMTKFPEDNYMNGEYTPYMVTELSLSPGECVYGLGERFTPFVKNGQVVDIWNEDGGTASQMAYKNIPFYVTSNHYGVYVDHSDNVSYEVGSEKVENVGISVPGEEIRYHVIYGPSMKDVIETYTDFTGKPALPPAWSFGLWLSTSFTTNYDEETTSSFIQGMEDRNIPLSVFHFDCFWMKDLHWCDFEWDDRVFPDVEGMLKRYKERGLKICVWINPYIAQGTNAFRECKENGYLLMRRDKMGVKQLDNWQPGMGLVDFTNPKAVLWYQNKLRALIHMGVDCFKTDFGERIPIDVTYYNGADPKSMHNYYTNLYNRCVFEVLLEEKGEGEAVLFARSATVGGQQFPVHWGGDCSATYISMAESLRGGLSFTMSGFSYWSHDIGGFELTATPDLYKRWMQFGLLSTHSRLHGSKSYRVPWLFDDEASEVCRRFTILKAKLMPYIYRAAVESNHKGIPVMRSMVMEFEEDMATRYLDMQYMLGDSILVAPVFSETKEVDYYLPEGNWTHLLTGEERAGGKWYRDQYDYFSLPLYVRENTLLPIGAVEDKTDYDFAEGVEIQIYNLVEDRKAMCEVTDVKGNVVLKTEAVKSGNRITITSNTLTKGIKYVLKNINKSEDIVITPETEEVTVDL
ncbi:alpha-D-xyloside xylohydrolase [Aequitasia blattaphilus]|uniref:Alpha-xylosidase n=1 Tax=Aequitasia blattaphilus TaxID=2949332 RepID=A0ABT1EB13_9FIRM|nr:alpha-xylosidase [Aequitasia blattaphilus]MCP1103002.1 alpha-xylosidase [Aequitasia blattaphilus]MCR8615642.1 alpha-xylosidase [Aequitasia blattaphilus]